MPPNMEMSDVRWPSLREAARRILKQEGCILRVPQGNLHEAHSLTLAIGDKIPERIKLPTIEIGDLSCDGLFQIGGPEPELSICWVPNANWEDFHEQVMELLEAGYPGCVGCAGPGAEGAWDEASRRREFS